jgi:rRNA-processing protein FCF1
MYWLKQILKRLKILKIRLNGKESKEMSGGNVVLDSNIMIYLSQGKIPVDDLIRNGISYFISAITYMEVMGYKFESRSEEKAVSNLIYK